MLVAVLRPFGPRGTAETPIARSHSMPSRARRRTASLYHISGYLGQRDEPSEIGYIYQARDINQYELRFEQLTTEATLLTDELKETYPV